MPRTKDTPPTILLTRTPGHVDASRWDTPLCIHTGDDSPLDCDSLLLDEFRDAPWNHLDDYETAVFAGLTGMMTPSNRTDDLWEVVFNQMDMPTVSVDSYLFRSDPWRAWFQFGLVGAEYRDYTYSYLAETDYDQYFNGQSDDNPFSLTEICKWGAGVIDSEYDHYFEAFDTTVGHEAEPGELYGYSELLGELFAEKNTIGQVRRGLESYADDIYPERNVPSRHQLFRGGREWHLRTTDLPIDRWKTSYLRSLAELTDGIADAFYDETANTSQSTLTDHAQEVHNVES